MSFGWLIWLLFIIILIGSERSHLSELWGWDFGYRSRRNYRIRHPAKTAFEQRLERAKAGESDVVVVSRDEHIANPDPDLETLIKEDKLDEAMKHRDAIAKIAEEMDDDDSMRKYAVYGARIAHAKKQVSWEKRRQLIKKYEPVFISEKPEPASDPIEIELHDKPPEKKSSPPIWRLRKSKPAPAKASSAPEHAMHVDKDDMSIKKHAKPPLWGKKTGKQVPEPVKPEPVKTEKVVTPPAPPQPPLKKTPSPGPPEVKVPETFTPPPVGPVKLAPSGTTGYKSGPLRSDEFMKSKTTPADSDKPDAKKSDDDDEYTNLISI